ncbi:hypothetical protein [Amycolatopsis sp. NPDC054798]
MDATAVSDTLEAVQDVKAEVNELQAKTDYLTALVVALAEHAGISVPPPPACDYMIDVRTKDQRAVDDDRSDAI